MYVNVEENDINQMHESRQNVNNIILIYVVVFDLRKKKRFIYMIFATWGVG